MGMQIRQRRPEGTLGLSDDFVAARFRRGRDRSDPPPFEVNADRFPESEPATGRDAERAANQAQRVARQPRQSEDGSGFASFNPISWSQHSMAPSPGLLQRASVPHCAHM